MAYASGHIIFMETIIKRRKPLVETCRFDMSNVRYAAIYAM